MELTTSIIQSNHIENFKELLIGKRKDNQVRKVNKLNEKKINKNGRINRYKCNEKGKINR